MKATIDCKIKVFDLSSSVILWQTSKYVYFIRNFLSYLEEINQEQSINVVIAGLIALASFLPFWIDIWSLSYPKSQF